MRAWALLLADNIVEQPWRALSHAVLTGELAFCHVFGSDIWTYLSGNPTSSDLFDGAMQSMTQGVNASLVSCYPFGNFKWIVEVGGGIGSLLVPILAQNPEMRGTIVELPQVAEEARKRLSAAGLASRCEVVAGDALVAVPTGADAYVLKHVIHDFEDDKAAFFLRNCRSAIQGEGKVIIIDRLLPDQADPGDARALGNFLLDIMMMLLPGGKERTEKEFRDLFAMAGLRLNRTIATPGPPSIIETVPV